MLPKKKLRQCLACDAWFAPTRPDQAYHSDACRKRNSHKKDGVRRAYELPPAALMNTFLEFLRCCKPKGAMGYRLYCRELEMFLPAPLSLRRDGHRPKTEYFTLEPIEIPLVPFPSTYPIFWVFPGGFLLPSDPPQSASIGWADDMKRHGEVGRRLREYLRKQAQAEKEAREDFARRAALSGHDEPALLPHHKGQIDDDGSTA